jgi:hypothetical protein
MPEQYVAIKKKLQVEGMSEREAKSHAARIYIAGVKSKKGRSERAKALHDK